MNASTTNPNATTTISSKAVWGGRILSGLAAIFTIGLVQLGFVYVKALLWGGLWLRDRRLRGLI